MANLGLRISRMVLGVSVLALACVQCERDTQPFGEVTRKVDVTLPALGIEDIIIVEPMGSRAELSSDEHNSTNSLFSVRLCSESDVLGLVSEGLVAVSEGSTRASNDGDSSGFGLASAEFGSPTRASVALSNVWVLQFDASGVAKTCAYVGSVAAGQNIKATLQSGSDYTLWVIANGPASGGLTTANVGSLSNFESALLCTLTPASDNLVPMSGKLSNVRILNNGQMLVDNNNAIVPEITLSRCMARIDLLLEYNVSGAALDGVWLYNVPVGASYGLDNSTESFPDSATASNFEYTDANYNFEGMTSHASGSGTVTHTWYIGDNRRGVNNSIQWEKDKSSSKAPAMATFARIKSHETANVTQALFHDVYLGDNVVTDFNVLRNHQYIYRVRIGGTLAQQQLLATTDSRVSASDYSHISSATVSPDPTSGIAEEGATYTITLEGFWSGNNIPIRAYSGSTALVSSHIAYNSTDKNGSATLAVPANDGSSERTIEFQYQWQGNWITIKSGTQEVAGTYVLDITSSVETTYAGGNVNYTVKSCKESASGKITPVAWSAEYSTDDGATWSSTKPTWLTAFTASGTGSTTADGDTLIATIAAQTGSTTIDTTSPLYTAAEVGTETNPYDLSMYNALGTAVSGMTTANCYVVRAGGWYRIPMVYGNAVKNGAVNTNAYSPGSVSGGLATFVKHDNSNITAPCLADNSGVVPNNAVMVWNDVSDSFITVKSALTKFTATIGGASKSLDYIVFNIPKASIAAGNAVIAVRDASNTILWSWHIWVTADDLTPKAVTNYMNEVNNMMPVNLGWVSTATAATTYAARSCQVRISQDGTSNKKVLTISQTAGSVTTSSNNSPYYQWGRKDPFLPSNGSGNTDKTVFGTKWSHENSTTATIGTNIQNPTVHYYNSSIDSPCNTNYINMWSAKNTKTKVAYNVADETVVKTVYDPCPAGFTVAPANAYTGFSLTGEDAWTSGEFNVSGAFDKGWNFYCGKNKTGATIFFPAAGRRDDSSGALGSVTITGYYWTAVSSLDGDGNNLSFFYAQVITTNNYGRTISYSVRPVQEK